MTPEQQTNLKKFIQWLEEESPTLNMRNLRKCAIGQYAKHVGYTGDPLDFMVDELGVPMGTPSAHLFGMKRSPSPELMATRCRRYLKARGRLTMEDYKDMIRSQ